jgi:lipoprotein-anchoring transpeptidase ErfK/SrfK
MVVALLFALALAAAQPRPSSIVPDRAHASCTDALSYEIRLDRIGFSVGEIDGRSGPNLRKAVAAYQEKKRLAATGQMNCDTLHALEHDAGRALLTDYTITDRDAEGPFLERPLPKELPAQAGLPALSYRSLTEAIAERFHASPQLLVRLNPRVHFAAGVMIRVPDVAPFDAASRPKAEAASPVTIHVSRNGSTLRAVRADGEVVMFAPVTSGSGHDPLPVGHWRVTGVAWMPTFHYNPELFWDANPADSKTTIAAGPNNPVGVVWIDINVPHYGLHGTPEPALIGRARSHGCVRLTNWDAARLASIVRVGTPVVFEE